MGKWDQYAVETPTDEPTGKWDQYAAPAPIVPTDDEPDVSMLESGARALHQGITGNFQDELAGFGKTLGTGSLGSAVGDVIYNVTHPSESNGSILPQEYIDKILEDYRSGRDKARENNAKARTANKWTYGTANLIGSLAPMIAMGGNPESALQAFGQGALQGGTAAAGGSEADLTNGDVGDFLKDTAIGAGIGGTVNAGAYKLFNALTPTNLSANAERAAARATGAGAKEFEKMAANEELPSTVMDIQKYGRKMLDEGVVTPLASTEEMAARAGQLADTGAAAQKGVYQAIDKQGASTFNPLDVATQAETKLNPTYRTPINKVEWGQLDNTIESILARGDGNIPLTEAQALKQEIKAVAYPKGQYNPNPSPKQQMAMEAYTIVRDAIDKAAKEGSDTIGGDALQNILREANMNYGAGTTASKLLAKKLAKEQAGTGLYNQASKIFDVGSLVAAIPTGGASLKGLALKKGAEAIANKGNQLAATGMDALANVLRTTPQYFGKFAPALQSAAQRGPEALASTMFVLSEQNPEFRQMKDQIEGE